jgi:iron complex outermembrane receptor protein
MKAMLLLALLPAVCLCGPAYLTYAQLSSNKAVTPIATGRIAGVLKDPSGAVVPGARIEVTNLASKVRRTLVTNLAGRFSFDRLPLGIYQATITANGFDTAILRDISVVADAKTAANVTLKIARVRIVVEVNAPATEVGSQAIVSRKNGTSDTTSLLDGVPGVSLYGNGGVSSLPVIHGMEDDRVRIIVDGMDLISACANHMNPPLSYVDPSNVGSVKVFAGITPVSVGGDSIGGTISVNSSSPEFAVAGEGPLMKGRAGTFYRQNGGGVGANLELMIASENLAMMYSGSFSRSDNYTSARDFKAAGLAAADRGWLAGNAVGSSRYEAQNHALAFALRHDNHLVELKIDLQHIPYQGFPNQRMDMTLNNNIHANLHYTGKHPWGTFETRIYGDITRHEMDFGEDKQFNYVSSAGLLAPGMPMDTKGLNLGAAVKAYVTLSAQHTLKVGFEAQRYRLQDWWPSSPAVLPPGYTTGGMAPNTFINIKDGQRDRIGIFAEWEGNWNPRWTSLLGVRSDTVLMNTGQVHGYNDTMYNGAPLYPASTFNASDRKRTDGNFDVTALSRYKSGATLEFEAGYARKSHSPNLYQRYAWSTNTMAMEMVNLAGDGNYYVGNLGLRPEVANTFSATADWHDAAKEKRGIAITPYVTYVDDYIDPFRCPTTVCGSSAAVVASTTATTGFVYLQFANSSARLYGFDASVHSALADTSHYGNFTATAILSAVRGENRSTGDNLYNIMPVNAKLAVVQNLGHWTNTVEEELVGAKKDVSQVRDEHTTGGYGLLGLRSSYERKKVRFDVGLENLLNKFYALPLGGAYVGQGPTMKNSTLPWGIPIPGMGRNFHGGLTFQF